MIVGISLISMAGAVTMGILKGKMILKDIENDYIERLAELEDENVKYKKLIRDTKVELRNCRGTQFYGNTKLALNKVLNVITTFENDNY